MAHTARDLEGNRVHPSPRRGPDPQAHSLWNRIHHHLWLTGRQLAFSKYLWMDCVIKILQVHPWDPTVPSQGSAVCSPWGSYLQGHGTWRSEKRLPLPLPSGVHLPATLLDAKGRADAKHLTWPWLTQSDS